MPTGIDLLAIGAHPDDVEMTSGGWLALAAQQGYSTGVLHLTRGEMGSHGTPETRTREAEKSAEILGCQSVTFAGLMDGSLNDDRESVETIVALLRELRPRTVIAPYFVCHHPDHEATAKIVQKAVHLASLRGYVDQRERHVTQRLVHGRYSHTFEPSFFVDISSVIETKIESILAYHSQVVAPIATDGEPPTRLSRPGFVDQLKAVNASFGLRTGCDFAEGYFLKTAVRLNDPIAVFDQGPPQNLIR